MAATCNNKTRESFNFIYVVRLSLPVLWAGIICWLSLTSSPLKIPGLLGWDKLLHAAAYALLTILAAQYLHIFADSWKTAFYAGCTAILYGGLMEVLQLLLQRGRTAEWPDLVADIVGSIAGCVIFRQAAISISKYHARRNEHHG